MAKTASPEPEQVPADSVRCLDRSASSTNSRDKRPRNRYATEPARLLGVLDERLAGRDWMMGADYSIADISLLRSARNLIGFYEAREIVGFDRLLHVPAWLDCGLARPAEQRRLEVTSG
jgi:GST-like protein